MRWSVVCLVARVLGCTFDGDDPAPSGDVLISDAVPVDSGPPPDQESSPRDVVPDRGTLDRTTLDRVAKKLTPCVGVAYPLAVMGDVDISLRSVASAMPEDVSGALFPGAKVEIKGWRESQLTQMERRVDDLLELVVDGEPLLQHVEWQLEWEGDLPERAYTYQSVTVLSQLQQIAKRRAEATARRAAGEANVVIPQEEIVPVETAVVLLSGRQATWEPELQFRTSRKVSSFNGVHLRVVAVYQHTVAELLAMPGRLWLVFAPIARDASIKTVQRAVKTVGKRARTRDELADLLATMAIVAESRGATDAIQEMLMKAMDDQGVTFTSKLYRRGRDDGMQAGLGPIQHQFERKLGRNLTEQERETLRQRLESVGAVRLGDVALDLEGDALAAWIASPTA